VKNKNVGAVLIALSVVLGFFFLKMISGLSQQAGVYGCNPSQQCQSIASSLNTTHFLVGLLAAVFSLGVYLFFFNASEEAILKRLELEKEKSLAEERLAIMLQALDESEKAILKAIAEQDGITQKTLALRTGFSKAKVSQVLTSFERKGIVKREAKGKTYSVHLLKPF